MKCKVINTHTIKEHHNTQNMKFIEKYPYFTEKCFSFIYYLIKFQYMNCMYI